MPTQVETQPQGDPRTNTATAEPGSEDEAIALFNQRAQSQASPEADPPADEPEEGASEPEAVEADPANAADPADSLIEVEYEGKTFTVPPELKDALLRKSDYSRSMNALSDAKKDYAQRIESAQKLIEGAEKLAEAKAEAKQIDAQLKQYESVDWTTMERDDPARASLLAVKFLQLQQARASVGAKEQSIESTVAGERAKDMQAKQAEMLKVLAKDFPGWGEEAGTKVSQYAIKSGWAPEEIRNFTDPRLVLALEKARKFDAIQDGKRAAQAAPREVPPVAKPGVPRRSSPVVDVQARFQKTNSPDDAVALFEARAAQRRR